MGGVVEVKFTNHRDESRHVEASVLEPVQVESAQTSEAPNVTNEEKKNVTFKMQKAQTTPSGNNIFSTAKSWVHKAMNMTSTKNQTAEGMLYLKNYVQDATALKPHGWDNHRILTLDEVDYAPMMTELRIIKDVRKKEGRPFYESFDRISAMGQASIVAAYLASPMGDDIDGLIHWWKNTWCQAFQIKTADKLERGLKGLIAKLVTFKNVVPEGYSRKRAEELIFDLFIDKTTGLPLKVKDLETDIYIPVIDYDRITWPHTKETSPETLVADVVIDSALDPFFFESGFRKGLKNVGVLMGAISISPDYFIARENKGAKLVSIGADDIRFYKHSKKEQTALTRGEVAASRRAITRQLEIGYIEDYCRASGVDRQRYAFKSVDGIREDSTNEEALQIAYEAGSGIVFPEENPDSRTLYLESLK